MEAALDRLFANNEQAITNLGSLPAAHPKVTR
jgi:hypothetical protein